MSHECKIKSVRFSCTFLTICILSFLIKIGTPLISSLSIAKHYDTCAQLNCS